MKIMKQANEQINMTSILFSACEVLRPQAYSIYNFTNKSTKIQSLATILIKKKKVLRKLLYAYWWVVGDRLDTSSSSGNGSVYILLHKQVNAWPTLPWARQAETSREFFKGFRQFSWILESLFFKWN